MKKSQALLVEDHPAIREALVSLLEGYVEVVGVVERGDQVVEAALQLQPDLVLLDISLPVQSGLQILPLLRATLPQAVIVVVTVHELPIYQTEAFKRGADVFLNKGQLVSKLMPAIEAASSVRLQERQA